MSKVKPILFNTEMVRAILDGRKTVTRRLVKLPKHIKEEKNGLYTLYADGTCYENQHMEELTDYLKPPYQPGDSLYLRETWKVFQTYPSVFGYDILYAADEYIHPCIFKDKERYLNKFCKYEGREGWNSPYSMPKEAARIWIKVTDIRVERLQDMSTNGAMKEGIHYCECPDGFTWKTRDRYA